MSLSSQLYLYLINYILMTNICVTRYLNIVSELILLMLFSLFCIKDSIIVDIFTI